MSGLSRKLILIISLLFVSLLVNAAEFKFKELLAEQGQLWHNSPRSFMAKCGWNKFKWNSTQRDSLYYSSAIGGTLRFGKSQVVELIARFTAAKLTRLEISLYNRGDTGEMPEALFQQKLKNIATYLDQVFDYKTTPKKHRARLVKSKIFHAIWRSSSITAKLRWSESKLDRNERPEFISLYIYPANGNTMSTKASVDKKNLPKRVKTDKAGNQYLEVPMVDQGAKGYCVVAVIERVMKYYGSDVDQNLLAELVNSSATQGTSLQEMRTVLRTADSKLGVKFKTLYENRAIYNFGKFSIMLKKYNKMARRAHGKRLKINLFLVPGKTQHIYDPVKFIYNTDPEIFANMRMKYYSRAAKRVFKDIEKYITCGIPILWSVQLGIYPEKGILLTKGGHMRLIVGFNRKIKTIFYSDSWGRGHELKKIPYKQAWAMTSGIYLIQPRFQR